MIKELVKSSDEVLKSSTQRFDFDNPPMDPVELSHILSQTLISHNALGLAANQIGIPYSVFAIKANPMIVCFNPRIVDVSEDEIFLEEGCLSFPGVTIKIKRPEVIKVRYNEPNGEILTTKFQGMTARVFQHELAHLHGRTFFEDANFLNKQKALKKWKKLNK